jgi:hypothetical protein
MTNQVVVICEDQKMGSLARRFLKKRYSYTTHDIRMEQSPGANGSGEQWVREKYCEEIKALSSRKARSQEVALVVMTDADSKSVEERIATLLPQPKDSDPVLMIVPKRNIETWLVYLSGSNVDESQNYKHNESAREVTEHHVNALDRMCRSAPLREPAPPSLVRACSEMKKLPRASKS